MVAERQRRTSDGSGPRGRRTRRVWQALCPVLVGVLAIAGCGSSGGEAPAGSPPSSPSASSPRPVAGPFDPAAGATITLPDPAAAEVPLVVLVPGGGWWTADPSGLIPLAEDLAARGAAVVTLTYRAGEDGAFFPVPLQDVACGLAYARTAVAGQDVEDVVVVGHSAGAHLAALVALAPDESAGADCAYGTTAPDALVGLAGPYDVRELGPDLTDALFGAGGDPGAREAANPFTHVTQRPDLPVLLVHGTADDLVPLSFTEDFAAALIGGGHPVTTQYPEGADHFTVFSPEVAGPPIAEWLGLA